ncbi:hypothetical protein B0O80DRAFT_284478 [Mortierella sp. GBAus27b]|nr:hypothetical protein B0O80DRAFT_284478 [Mortierella sp. GBAus27b]
MDCFVVHIPCLQQDFWRRTHCLSLSLSLLSHTLSLPLTLFPLHRSTHTHTHTHTRHRSTSAGQAPTPTFSLSSPTTPSSSLHSHSLAPELPPVPHCFLASSALPAEARPNNKPIEPEQPLDFSKRTTSTCTTEQLLLAVGRVSFVLVPGLRSIFIFFSIFCSVGEQPSHTLHHSTTCTTSTTSITHRSHTTHRFCSPLSAPSSTFPSLPLNTSLLFLLI